MKTTKNGWGTTQMFALSGGLFVALLVSIFFIGKLYGSYDNSVKNTIYSDLERKIEKSAMAFIINNAINTNDGVEINYKTLKDTGYIDNLIDKDGNECDGYVKVEKIDGINQYDGEIICNNYKSLGY